MVLSKPLFFRQERRALDEEARDVERYESGRDADANRGDQIARSECPTIGVTFESRRLAGRSSRFFSHEPVGEDKRRDATCNYTSRPRGKLPAGAVSFDAAPYSA